MASSVTSRVQPALLPDSPPLSPIKPEGSSRATGGIVRGKAAGNPLDIGDMPALTRHLAKADIAKVWWLISGEAPSVYSLGTVPSPFNLVRVLKTLSVDDLVQQVNSKLRHQDIQSALLIHCVVHNIDILPRNKTLHLEPKRHCVRAHWAM